MAEDLTIFVKRAEVEALVRHKGRVSWLAACLSLKSPHPTTMVAKLYLNEYIVSNFKKFDLQKGNTNV